MDSPSLPTLGHDILYELLILAPNLKGLRQLILTHPVFYQVFSAHRRLILRHVFAVQTDANIRPFYISKFLTTCTFHYAIDRVALREALWPQMKQKLPANRSVDWATALLLAYHRANLLEEAVAFADSTIETVKTRWTKATPDIQLLARSVVRIYMMTDRMAEAIKLQEDVRSRLKPEDSAHETWSKELASMYESAGDHTASIALHLDCWELYKVHLGNNNAIALHWAREAFYEYQHAGDEVAALAFHGQVRLTLPRRCREYRGWSRQLINLLQRHGRDTDALAIMEEVWRNYDPENSGYRAWASWLCDHYNKLGRYNASVAVWETVLAAYTQRLKRRPTDKNWNFQARGAALDLAKAYRRIGNSIVATKLEAQYTMK